MPRISPTQAIITALISRGYCKCNSPGWALEFVVYAISPHHKRALRVPILRVGTPKTIGDRVYIRGNGAIRVGTPTQIGKPLPKRTRDNLVEEGTQVWAQTQSRPLMAATKTPNPSAQELDL